MVDISNIKFGKIKRVSNNRFKNKDISKFSILDTISPPSIFIGSKLTYPIINVGILSPINDSENVKIYDDCKSWAKNNFSIQDVIRLRSNLLNSRFRAEATNMNINKKFVEIAKNIAVSSQPVDVEIELKNKINFKSSHDKILPPHGMRAQLKNAEVTSNIKINKFIDRAINDDIKSVDGMNILYKRGIDEYNISKILSVGVMGLSKNKKMVPTKWSITATDDIISKEIMKKIRNYPDLSEYELFFGEYLGNEYLIMLFPGVLSFELFELYYPGSSWNPENQMKASHDYEGFFGRTKYAENCAGGYYATRLPIMRYLENVKKQAGILVVRLETPSYWAGLGVWVVRESVEKSIASGSMKFNDKNEFLESVKKIGKLKYDFDLNEIYNRSWLLKEHLPQKLLKDFGVKK